MKYMVEDTRNGYRLTMLDSKSGKPRHHYDEVGGHGPVEALFVQADGLWEQLRSEESRGTLRQKHRPSDVPAA